MYIKAVTNQIDEARALIKNVQPTLREFVLNKDFPLDVRFEVWEWYCNKDDSQVPNKISDKMIDSKYSNTLMYLFNLRNLSWCELTETYTGHHTKEELSAMEDAFGSYDNLRELLIETNFGRYEK